MVVEEHRHCPTCRTDLRMKDVSVVREMIDERRGKDAQAEGAAPKHGSKMARIVEELKKIREKESGAKIIMFCQWEKLMKYVSSTLLSLGEPKPLQLRGTMPQRQATLRDFATSKKPEHSVLLLSLEKSPTGMNLVNCHHLFLIHPMYARTKERATAYELQAIGRLRRMGQKETVIVHRFVTKGTIEEEITQRHQTHLEQVDDKQRSGDKNMVDTAKVEEAAKEEEGTGVEAATEVQEALLAEARSRPGRSASGPAQASKPDAASPASAKKKRRC